MIRPVVICLTLAVIALPTLANAFRFPEIGVCPLGGPPGWFNRFSGQQQRYYYAPAPPMRSPWTEAQPSYRWPSAAPTDVIYPPHQPALPGY